VHWNGHCWYSSSNDRLTFEAAKEACREVNGHASLASIHQQWDNRFLSGQTKSELKLIGIDFKHNFITKYFLLLASLRS
jgi:hypothetical protein